MTESINRRMTVLGPLPEDWEVRTIEQIATITTGSQNTQDNIPNGKYPFYVRSQQIERINKWIFDTEGVVTAGDGVGTGKVFHYVNGKFGLHQRCYLIHNFVPEVNARFFYWVFKNLFYERVHGMTAKSSVDSVRREMIADMFIPLPPIEEQKQIADALSGVDDIIEALDEAIAKKRQIKEGLMQQLLTGKTRLPGFSGEWKESTLGQLADICKGVQFDSNLFSVNGRYPMLNGGITPSGYSEFYNTGADTITISEGGNSCGFVNYMTEKFWCGGHCYSLKVKSVDKLFLYQLLKFNEKDIMALRVGSGLPNVQSKSLVDFRLLYSEDRQEQKSISIILKKADDEIASLESQREKYTLIKQGMMQELLTGKTRLI